MEEWKRIRQNAPEEVTMQIGKLEEHVSREVLFDCYSDYAMRMEKWNEEHGHPFTVLTRALHADEAVPHVQERRVWHWISDAGDLRIGQERALRQAGLDLPRPDRPEGRRNNRKMVFDAMAREVWLDVLHDHGLEIEREPVPNGRHNREKEDMIRDKYEALLEENKRLVAQNERLQHDIQELTETKDYADEQLMETTRALLDAEDRHVEKKIELRAMEAKIEELNQLIPATRAEYDLEAKRAWGLLDALRLKMQEVFNSRRLFRNRKEEGKLLKAVEDARDALLASLSALAGFEAIKHVPNPQRRSSVIRRTLDEMMKEADRDREELPPPRRNRRDRDDRDL